MPIYMEVIFLLILANANAQILLYNTENQQTVEKYDCLYYQDEDEDIIPYCQRPYRSQLVDRNETHCHNAGQKLTIRECIELQVHPDQTLEWSWTIEMADLYATIFYNRSLSDIYWNHFVCNCTQSGTFGKYCEYQLAYHRPTFSQSVKDQLKQKKDNDSWNTQRYGKILCYETLSCPLSPLCLDWREICDGVQRCENGVDEENCDKLEFNECEDDEFRYINGMCIAEEFWLDGEYFYIFVAMALLSNFRRWLRLYGLEWWIFVRLRRFMPFRISSHELRWTFMFTDSLFLWWRRMCQLAFSNGISATDNTRKWLLQ